MRTVKGQSTVEFAVMFVVFFIFIFACLSIILWGYNFNILQRAGYEASRQFAIGSLQEAPIISNWEAGTRAVGYNDTTTMMTLYAQLSQKLIPLPLFQFAVTNMQFSLVRQRNPEPNPTASWAEYTDGNKARITMDYTYGISLGVFGEITSSYPLVHEFYIVRGNDEDRDGRDDTYEGRWANDHDNDGALDGDTDGSYDLDDDGDGVQDYTDTGMITRDAAGTVQLWTYQWSSAAHSDTQWVVRRTITDNRFHVPLWYNTALFPNLIFPSVVPQNAANRPARLEVSLKYDSDNDGWQDCFDYSPGDANVH
ncbi:MAG TPA: TadE/TadG family type IV pilus assembly protein [bacterium]|nr:TadE/TadG family type IV pilus assembly protein [bacterium]